MARGRDMNMYQVMKLKNLVVGATVFLTLVACRPGAVEEGSSGGLFSSSSTKVKDLDVKNYSDLYAQAKAGNYLALSLQAGDKVMYSASYGVGGEAAQAWGKLVSANGGLFFKQLENPSNNLLVAPGAPHSSSGGSNASLWDFEAYSHLVHRVGFGGYATGANRAIYSGLSAAIVNFSGKTAGEGTRTYSEALEISLTNKNQDGSTTRTKIWLSKGCGVIGMEYTENGSVGGTSKMYRDALCQEGNVSVDTEKTPTPTPTPSSDAKI